MIGADLARNFLAALGRTLRGARSEPHVSDLNFFFATPALGGAERVHADIVAAVADQHPTVFFSEQTANPALLPEFNAHAKVVDLSADTATRFRFYTRLGAIAAAINARRAPIVFGGLSDFFYRLLPHLAPHVRCIDILHNVGWRFEHLSLPHVERLEKRVLVSFLTLEQIAAQYREHGVNDEIKSRLRVIENCCDVPPAMPSRQASPLRVLFVGRGSPEKRVHLVGRIAGECRRLAPSVEFTLVGDVEPCVDAQDRPACNFAGTVLDGAELRKFYEQAHVLVLTSRTEGFPLVVMEAMAQGCVPLCTNVGGLRFRLAHSQNGLLFEPENESALVLQMAGAIAALDADRALLERMSSAAFATASQYFRRERFRAEYRELLLGASPEAQLAGTALQHG